MVRKGGSETRRIIITFSNEQGRGPKVEFEGQFFGRDILSVNRSLIIAYRTERNRIVRETAVNKASETDLDLLSNTLSKE